MGFLIRLLIYLVDVEHLLYMDFVVLVNNELIEKPLNMKEFEVVVIFSGLSKIL